MAIAKGIHLGLPQNLSASAGSVKKGFLLGNTDIIFSPADFPQFSLDRDT
jgi:hypothetical protein